MIWFAKTQIPEGEQLWVAAGYATAMMAVVVATYPWNVYQAAQRRFLILLDEKAPSGVQIPFPSSANLYIREMRSLEVDGILVPRTEVIIPLDKPMDISGVSGQESLGKINAVSLRFHGLEARRFSYKDGIVYYNGTPYYSQNCEIVLGYFVNPMLTLGTSDFGPTAVFEVVLSIHGDRHVYTDTGFMDRAWAAYGLRHPEEFGDESEAPVRANQILVRADSIKPTALTCVTCGAKLPPIKTGESATCQYCGVTTIVRVIS
jgi:predicted RNA-binding Zn-ribbon protein involved in translation (DUF1610 family)